MKKIIMTAVMCVAFVGFADSFSDQVGAARAAKNLAQLNVLLGQATNSTQRRCCYGNIVSMKPVAERVAFIEAINDPDLTTEHRKRLVIIYSEKGSNKNALLRDFFSRLQDPTSAKLYKYFDPSCETKESCISFYELILKNIPLTEESKESLGFVKGELLKLKDL